MSAYSGQKNIFSSIMSSNRTNTYTESLIGLFARFIPILIKIEDINLIDLIKQYMDVILTCFSYNMSYSSISNGLDLPPCNSWFKYDTQEMISIDNNKNGDFLEQINTNEVYKIFKKEDHIKHSEVNDSMKEQIYSLLYMKSIILLNFYLYIIQIYMKDH
ncbi:hypothetical protein BCR32DRAFT_272068 [Anaeromyces robustus]|uniref:Uncharacterized protein n=1 Tax=Anaeromyces robustus TaxID=1754192 RepID=A0A1Y1WNS2_9FUNG|nr:hypothetical protein BCR32DRAFT_272068 [Anaeromyces robustus]|eukprot:ORX75181.1 hypothetical protein BCR32DRAFT_272068 [Anaeromyces robustus]